MKIIKPGLEPIANGRVGIFCVRAAVAIAVMLAGLMLSGCLQDIFVGAANNGSNEAVPALVEYEIPERKPPDYPDPTAALDGIYEFFEGSVYESVDMERLKEIIGITRLPASSLYARHSHPRGGLADVVIIKPEVSAESEVREALYRYRDRRIAEFENFDVLGSLEIARGAVIFEHGEYLILLMTSDNDEAHSIINWYIPL